MDNCSMYTLTSELILRGLTDDPVLKVPVFLVLLSIYSISVLGNTGIILAIYIDPALHTPMYFFVSQLAKLDLFFSSVITPKTMADLNRRTKSITVINCAIQFLLYGGSAATENHLLAIMAYDRCIAIRQPLHYIRIMSRNVCKYLVAAAYIAGYFNICVQTYFTLKLNYLKDNIIDHFYCDLLPIIKLACSNTFDNTIVIFFFCVFESFSCVSVILYSYINIVITILSIKSTRGRRKAFSTCVSHLTCVSIFYGTVMFTYLRPPSDYMLDNDKVISVCYTVVVPMLNPLIYSLRNRDVKVAITKMVNKNKLFTDIRAYFYTSIIIRKGKM